MLYIYLRTLITSRDKSVLTEGGSREGGIFRNMPQKTLKFI